MILEMVYEFIDEPLKKLLNDLNNFLLLIAGHKTDVKKNPIKKKFIDDVNSDELKKLINIYS